LIIYLLGRSYLGWRIQFMERLIAKLNGTWIMQKAVRTAAMLILIYVSWREDSKKQKKEKKAKTK